MEGKSKNEVGRGERRERERETDFYEEGILQDLRTTSFAFIPFAS